jgi:hypothetical protein
MFNPRITTVVLAAGLALSPAALAQFDFSTTIPGTFTDISATGAVITSGDDSSVLFTSSVTNALFTSPNLYASTNGVISTIPFSDYTNTSLPVAALNSALFPMWFDLFVDGTGSLKHEARVENGIGVHIIQWNQIRTYAAGSGGPRGTFEVKLFASGPVVAQFIYPNIDFVSGGSGATIGVQWSATGATQYSQTIANGAVLSVVAAATGACCLPGASCVLTTQGSCVGQNGLYAGSNTTCAQGCPTGGCCLPDTSCIITTGALCTAQSGSYRGNQTTCSPSCPPPTGSCLVTGALGGPSSWPAVHGTSTGRLFRDNEPDTCALSLPGGPNVAGNYAYDKYDFVNTTANAVCALIQVNSGCAATGDIYAGAYIGAFNPNNPLENNVASLGRSPQPTGAMSFTVPSGGQFSIVVSEVAPGTGCSAYDFTIRGGTFNCAEPPPCYANCDASTAAPILNVGDFTCFLQRFASGESYANCDASTAAPVLNVGDFTCFLQRFASGCP